jgi:hypothetical protein
MMIKTSISRSLLAVLGVAVLVGGCDILEVDNPNALVQEDAEKVEAAASVVNGAQARTASGVAGIYAAFSTAGWKKASSLGTSGLMSAPVRYKLAEPE